MNASLEGITGAEMGHISQREGILESRSQFCERSGDDKIRVTRMQFKLRRITPSHQRSEQESNPT